MNLFRRLQNSGFTIVELLVVIVVIGILASITLISYENVSRNAYNTQIIAGVTQYKETIEAYKAYFRKYPPTAREIANQQIAMVCLGRGYPDAYCGKITNIAMYEDAAFAAELAKIGEGGAISAEKLNVNSESFIGAAYGIDITSISKSPTGYARTIQYALRGSNADCKVEGAYSYALQESPPMTACEIILESVPAR